MSREHVEIVRAAQPSGVDLVSVFPSDREPSAELPLSLFAKDLQVEFISPDARLGPSQGLDALAAIWRDWLEPWQRYEIEAQEFIDAGDRVVVLARVRALTRRDAVEVEHAPAAVWTLRAGVVCRIEFYLDRDEAMRSAGLAQ